MQNPAATGHLPFFITSPGETDILLVAMAVFLLLAVLGIGIVYFRLHALPEHIAHGANKIQFQIVAVLALLALFTHNHAFWIAGLLLALVPIPDFFTPFVSISRSLERIADRGNLEPAGDASLPAETQVAQVIALPQTKAERPAPAEKDRHSDGKSRDKGD
jgi:hypothetical protein